MPTRRSLLLAAAGTAWARPAWPEVERAARGQSVFLHAWGGDGRVNAFIAWAAERMRMMHDIRLRHVRLPDTASAARAASHEAVDAVMLDDPHLPAAAQDDFVVPWRRLRLALVHDTAHTPHPPRDFAAMPAWAAAHPGRLTHPDANDAVGAAFLEQALIALAPDRSVLARPATEAAYAAASASFWGWYEALRPNLWRGGSDFPASGAAQRRLFEHGEIDISPSLNAGDAACGIAHGTLPPTARAVVLESGAVDRCSVLLIPSGTRHREAAMLLARFLRSPEAQARVADARLLGSATVLDVEATDQWRHFVEFPPALRGLTKARRNAMRSAPHPSWMARIATQWEGAFYSLSSGLELRSRSRPG